MKLILMLVLIPVAAFAVVATEKPKVIIEETKFSDDQKHILVPAKVDAQIQSLVTADVEAHVVQIVKSLGSSVKSGEVVMYLENKDPSFTYARVPIRSPIAGIISQVMTTQMSKVARGDRLFSVINPKSLKIYTEFSAFDSSLITIGSTGNFSLNGIVYPVRVVGISPLIDARTGTASSELEFVAGGKAMLPNIGSVGQVAFDISQGQVLLVNENALTYFEGKPIIRILKGNNMIEKKSVELGEQRENLFIIKSGLKAGDKVVVRSSRAIKDGEIIEVEKSEKN